MINCDHLNYLIMEKNKVKYYGEIWESNIFMSKGTYEAVVVNDPNCKILITRDGTTLSVPLKLVEFLF